ncbi:glycosyltransferase family 39 protein [Roseomonas eburnea]|uniref:Glycosyltransferase family 39 protein n=1 Tax=Neoroseomonas eburnea TaxID=1346889 RepID=A0A9X9X5E2_9PROT|nr:glycosyltransferase family 39 protein [Neoroseomonas eburnea]MBR0678928.1 glycosyltransferase family 39 protein [Neoroseomonas eburnea]
MPWLAALAALTALRLVVAAVTPLAPDEAYYWVWSRDLQAGYLDHPPMVALFIRAGTMLAGETAFGVRLLGPLSLALGSILLARAAEDLLPGRRSGPWAPALLNATLLAGVGAVTMTPDTPLLFFWTAALWAAARLHRSGDGRWWLAVGLFAGLALASKYTAVLFGAGLLIWMVLDPAARRWLARWQLWAGGAVAMLVFAPVIAWNAAHGWASFAKQGGRAGSGDVAQALRYLGELLGGQAGLATPLVFLLCVAGAGAAAIAWWRRRDGGALLLAALVLPGAALFLWQATGSRVQGNWPAVLYPAAAIAAAGLLQAPAWLRLRIPALVLGGAMTAAVYLQAIAAPLSLPRRSDPTLARLGGWDAFVAEVAAAADRTGAGFIAAEEYGLASLLAFRLPPGRLVVAMDPRWRLFTLSSPPQGVTGLLVRSERRGEGPPLWPGAEALPGPQGRLVRSRRGIEAEAYRLHRVTAAPGQPPAVVLPRPGT